MSASVPCADAPADAAAAAAVSLAAALLASTSCVVFRSTAMTESTLSPSPVPERCAASMASTR